MENTMKTNRNRTTVPTRKVGGKRYVDYDKLDLAILANARRWLNRHGLKRFDLDEQERARRMEIYRRQLEETGRIEYLPPASERVRTRPMSRFRLGDALGRLGQSIAG